MVQQIDPEILNRCKQKDQQAFKQLVVFYQNYAFQLAYRLICNADDARDIVQEAFLRVWKNIENYKMEVQFTTWLYKIVCNLSFDYLKSKKRRNNISFDQLPNIGLNSIAASSLEEELSNQVLARIIEAMANNLTPKQRIIFTLRDLQGLEIAEIKKILNINAENIKSNLYYARKNIREKLIIMNLI